MRWILIIMLFAMAGCGDTTNVTTAGPTSSNVVAQKQVQGAADFIPSNEACTTDMNTVFSANSKPNSTTIMYTNNSSQDGIFWIYPTFTVKFEWYTNSTLCVVSGGTPPPILAGSAAFIPSNTYCTAKMNEQYAIHGLSPDMRAYDYDSLFNNHSHDWRYRSQGIDLNFSWGASYGSQCIFSTDTYTPY